MNAPRPETDRAVTPKDRMIYALRTLPDDASFEDGIECLSFLRHIQLGLDQADRGQTVSHEEAKRRLARWLE